MANDDQHRLLELLDVLEASIGDFTSLVRELSPDEWDAPTDLPGWTVHDLVSHTAHLEAVLAGAPEETEPVPDGLAHVASLTGLYTEQGVISRRDRTREELLDEIESSVASRLAAMRADLPEDGSVPAPKSPGDVGWSWDTLLSNRPLDVWMHEQDIRRATGRPGNTDTPGARQTVAVFGRSLGFVLGKRAQATPGQSLSVEVTDVPARFVVVIGTDGRGRPATEDVPADVTLRMDTETFTMLCGGRRTPDVLHVDVEGDEDLASRFLAGMAVTT